MSVSSDSVYKRYLTAQVVMDRSAAREAWKRIPVDKREILDDLELGLDTYRGRHVEAPMGSTYKAHMSLIRLADNIADEYIKEVAMESAKRRSKGSGKVVIKYRNGNTKQLTPREFIELTRESPAMRAGIDISIEDVAGILDDFAAGRIGDVAVDDLTHAVIACLGMEEFYERLYKEIEDELGGEALLGLIAKAVRRSGDNDKKGERA